MRHLETGTSRGLYNPRVKPASKSPVLPQAPLLTNPRMPLTPGREWEELLHPVAPEMFFREYWEKTPLLIPGNPGRFAPLFSRAAFAAALLRVPYDEECTLQAVFRDAQGTTHDLPIHPRQIEDCMAAGMTIHLYNVQKVDPRLARFIEGLEARLLQPAPFRINCFASPAGAGMPVHIDAISVCSIQIEGTKRWKYSPRPLPTPVLHGFAPPPGTAALDLPTGQIARPDLSTFQEVTVKPGDLFHLPASSWHTTEALTDSLALSLVVPRTTPLEFLFREMEHRLYQRPEWRRSISSVFEGDAPMTDLGARLNEFQEFVRNLDAPALQNAWQRQTLRKP